MNRFDTFWHSPNAAAKLPKARLCQSMPEPNTKGPGVCCSSEAPPADGWGLRIRFFSRKFRENSAKKWAKVKMHFEGSGPVSLAKNA